MNRKGFTLIESLFSLFILSLSISLLTMVLPCLLVMEKYHVTIEDEIALYQLRKLILYASDITFTEEELNFYYMEDFVSLSLEKGRVVRKKGYVIYMDGLTDSYFSKKKGCLFLNYEKNKTQKKRFLGCES